MKKIIYSLLALSTTFFLSCAPGNQPTEQNDSTDGAEMHDETAAGHDHDHEAMVESAGSSGMQAVPEGAKVFFANLTEGAVVTSPVKVVMGVEGMSVHPAGEIIEGTGHHHIIVNGDIIASGQAVPADETHIHFGGGQTETELTLTPGKYKLTLQFADGVHRSYGEQLSTSINVEVKTK